MEELIGKITEIFLRLGVKSVTMDDIAKELGISKKTLYLHFTDKKDVVMKSVEYSMQHQKCKMNEVSGNNNDNAIDVLMKVSQQIIIAQGKINTNINFDLQKYYPEAWEKMKNFKQTHIYSKIKENIMRGIAENVYRNDFNVDVIYTYLISKTHIRRSSTMQKLNLKIC